ncbi:MAG: hypothetical protein M3252_04280, partial [Actinomycetota bacterium]|nr:hypothetical protein [Actinomycetota bacterium]
FEAGSMNDYEALPQARLPWSDQIRTGKFGGKQRPSPEHESTMQNVARPGRARPTNDGNASNGRRSPALPVHPLSPVGEDHSDCQGDRGTAG